MEILSSAQQDAIIEGCAMVKLAEATDALTLDEIIRGEPLLTGVTTQKLARVMMKFVDMGFVVKSKRRDGNDLGSFTAGKVGGILSIKLRS